MLDTGIAGRVAVVTGANNPRGIGAATCRALAREGARVLLHWWPDSFAPMPPDEVVAALRSAGAEVASCELDLGEPDAPIALLDAAERALGPVDLLVLNARHWEADAFRPAAASGRLWPPDPAPLEAERIDRHFAVTARASALAIAEYARRFAARPSRDRRDGRVVCLTTGGASGFPREASYGASKSALESYARAAASELAPLGITVNLVNPGATQTGWITPELEAQISAGNPFGRVGQPEDVADAILLLLSRQAHWITGQLLHCGAERLHA